jgi:hypothetical protein
LLHKSKGELKCVDVPQNKDRPIRNAIVMLTIIGVLVIVASAIYVSSFLAILGTSFVFWCVLLLYIMPVKHVPITFLNASVLADMSNIERILVEMGFDQKGVYLPPKCLNNSESSLLFIPEFYGQKLPLAEDVGSYRLFNDEQRNILCLTPPGVALLNFFEAQMNCSFTKIDFSDFQKRFPKVIVEDLGYAENIVIHIQDDKLTLTLKANIFVDNCVETEKELSWSHNAVGCLLSSSFACALAKVLGRAIIILAEETTGNITKMTYQILEV